MSWRRRGVKRFSADGSYLTVISLFKSCRALIPGHGACSARQQVEAALAAQHSASFQKRRSETKSFRPFSVGFLTARLRLLSPNVGTASVLLRRSLFKDENMQRAATRPADRLLTASNQRPCGSFHTSYFKRPVSMLS